MQTELLALWLPIAVSAVALFFASFIAWSVLPHHNKDWRSLPDEDAFTKATKDLGIEPGVYIFPHCATKQGQKDPEYIRKWKEGPAGSLNIWRPMSMGRNMALTFASQVLVSLLVAYVAGAALVPGAEAAKVFQVTTTMAVAVFTLGWLPNAIWFQKPARAIAMEVVDGIAYALIVGAAFALLWPGA